MSPFVEWFCDIWLIINLHLKRVDCTDWSVCMVKAEQTSKADIKSNRDFVQESLRRHNKHICNNMCAPNYNQCEQNNNLCTLNNKLCTLNNKLFAQNNILCICINKLWVWKKKTTHEIIIGVNEIIIYMHEIVCEHELISNAHEWTPSPT